MFIQNTTMMREGGGFNTYWIVPPGLIMVAFLFVYSL